MSNEGETPVMLTSQMKPMLAKDFCHDAKGRDRAAATYISGLWVHNDDGRMVVRFDDRDGENHYMGKSRVETALKKASISFEQAEIKDKNESRPGLAIPAAFAERAVDAIKTLNALNPPDKDGELLLAALEQAAKEAEPYADKQKFQANIAAAAKANAPAPKADTPPVPAGSHMAAVAKGKQQKGSSPSMAV